MFLVVIIFQASLVQLEQQTMYGLQGGQAVSRRLLFENPGAWFDRAEPDSRQSLQLAGSAQHFLGAGPGGVDNQEEQGLTWCRNGQLPGTERRCIRIEQEWQPLGIGQQFGQAGVLIELVGNQDFAIGQA